MNFSKSLWLYMGDLKQTFSFVAFFRRRVIYPPLKYGSLFSVAFSKIECSYLKRQAQYSKNESNRFPFFNKCENFSSERKKLDQKQQVKLVKCTNKVDEHTHKKKYFLKNHIKDEKELIKAMISLGPF